MEMLEKYYETAFALYMWGSTAITAYCYYYLAKRFMGRTKRSWAVGLSYFIVLIVLYYVPPAFSNSFVYALGAAAGFCMMYLLERRNMEQKIFLAVTFFSIRWLSVAIVGCVEELWQTRMYGAGRDWRTVFAFYAGESALNVFLVFALMLASIRIIAKVYVYKQENMTKKELAILLVPSLYVAVGYGMRQYYSAVFEKYAGTAFYDMDSWGAFKIFYYGMSYATILITIVLFQNIKAGQREEKQQELFLGQIADMKRHIREVEKLYGDIRSLKHDMGNHLLTLESLYDRKQYDEAEDYIAHLKKEFHRDADEIKSGNPVTDVILNEKRKEAEEKGIVYSCDFHYPAGTKADAFDLSIILNNALANAIEAAEGCKDAYIRVHSRRRKNIYMIEIHNSSSGRRPLDEESGLPVTTKEDSRGHGLGLFNIRRTARKYFGDIDIRQGEDWFFITVMLLLE